MKPKIVQLEFCTLEFYENYMICIINEGENIGIDESNKIAVEGDRFFTGSPFVYITNRRHSYSVDPSIYKYTSMVDNLKGFAVVTNNEISIASAKIEKLFLKKPFKIFEKLEDAKLWAKKIIADQSID